MVAKHDQGVCGDGQTGLPVLTFPRGRTMNTVECTWEGSAGGGQLETVYKKDSTMVQTVYNQEFDISRDRWLRTKASGIRRKNRCKPISVMNAIPYIMEEVEERTQFRAQGTVDVYIDYPSN
jgi:hypothetical protein